MARIPRSDPNVRLAMADQPTMSPDALTGPGRALQSLGKAISGLGSDMAEPSDSDTLASQLAQMDASTNSEKYYNERLASLTPDTDPDTWHQDTTAGINQIWNDAAPRVPQYPKLQQNFELNRHKFVGGYDVKSHGVAVGEKTSRFATGALETFKNALEGVDPTTPEGKQVIDTINDQLRRVPGINEEKAKAFLADELSKKFDAEKDPIRRLEKLDAIKKTWGEELRAPPEELPQQGLPGSQSGASVPRPQSSLGGQLPVGGSMAGKTFADVPASGGAENSRNWGGPRKGGQHAGLDIPGRAGDPVLALTGGTVLRAGEGQGYGNMVDVLAPDGTVHRFGHMKSVSVRQGQKLEAGQAVGALGHSGNAGAEFPHLHLEVFANKANYGRAQGQSSREGWNLRTDPRAYYGGLSQTAATDGIDPQARAAAADVAKSIGADPSAVGAVFTVESGPKWDKGAKTGSYIGVSQVGKATLSEMGISPAKYAAMSQAEQAEFYGKWLKHYNFSGKMAAAGIDFKSEPPARQAAILQAFQFAPNGDWAKRLGSGDSKTPVTNAKQAKALGDTSIADMERYFAANNRVGSTAVAAAPGTPVQVADASGRIPGSVLAGQIKDRVSGEARPTNTIPGPRVAQGGLGPNEFMAQQRAAQGAASAGEVRAPQPKYRAPSIRTHLLDKAQERMPAYLKAVDGLLNSYVDRAEKSAAEGYLLPEDERALINDRILRYGSEEQKIKIKSAEEAAQLTAPMKGLTPAQLGGVSTQMRAALNAGATPEAIAKTKAVEGLHTRMVKELGENSVGWAAEAGLIPPQAPITAEGFTTEALQMRKQAVEAISGHYGPEFKQYFGRDERENLTATFEKGGETMVVMMGRMYEAFGEDMPKAAAEIAPKAPEAVRAGYLLATGGSPQAVKDIAATIERHADPNYKGNIKLGDGEAMAREVLSDVFRKFPQQARDATMRAAEAIYAARVKDPTEPNDELFRQALKEAMGERTNSLGVPFGGVVETKPGALWGTAGDAIVLPSNVRKDTWRELLDTITVEDLKAANQALPVDGNGAPISMTRALNGRLVQTGPGKYAVSLGDPDVRGAEKWIRATPSAPPPGITVTEPFKPTPTEPFVLDLGALTPILRKRVPDLFWSE